jgi:renalase
MATVIVGAGLAGLTAARELTSAGHPVVVLDKGRRPGGRCATRSVDGATADTGAQFFTVRGQAFRDRVERWRAEGCPIRVWCDGFATAGSVADPPSSAESDGDGHPRHSVAGGMNRLAAHLARDVDIRTRTRATAVRNDGDAWAVTTFGADGRATKTLRAQAVVVTPPLPQALALLGDARTSLSEDLRNLDYEPCLALLLALDRHPRLPGSGGVQFAEGPVAWLGDNAAKGASMAPSLTVHAAGDWSETFYDADPGDVTALLLDLVRPWLSGAEPTGSLTFRWRYSKPRTPADAGAVLVADDPGPLILAGDALAGGKIEGAVTAGLTAAALAAA